MSAVKTGTMIHRTLAKLLDDIQAGADAIATEADMPNREAMALLWAGLSGHFTSSAGIGEMDARTARWRCRFRIYRADMLDEPAADTDDELPADRPGAMVLAGLPAVAAEARMLASSFHGTPALAGLSREETERKLRGLRPTLSRRGGNAVWRLPYDTLETFNDTTQKRGWLMRVDIQREESAP